MNNPTGITIDQIREFIEDPNLQTVELACPAEKPHAIVLVLTKVNGRVDHHLQFGDGRRCVMNPKETAPEPEFILEIARMLGLSVVRNRIEVHS